MSEAIENRSMRRAYLLNEGLGAVFDWDASTDCASNCATD